MQYYKRYVAGEHQAVWDELRSFGPALFESPHLEDARLVAAAAIDRAASNFERIAEALATLGFEFVSLGPGVPDAGSVNAAVQASAAEALLSHPGISREQAEQMLKAVPQLLGGLAGARSTLSPTELSVAARSSPFGNSVQFHPEIKAYEQAVGPIPLSVREFWRRLGSVDFTYRSITGEPMLTWKPIAVLPPIGLLDDHIEWKYDGGEEPFYADLVAAQDFHDPPLGADMTPGADSRLQTGEWFLDHLRQSIRSVCFPDAADDLPPQLRDIAGGYEPF